MLVECSGLAELSFSIRVIEGIILESKKQVVTRHRTPIEQTVNGQLVHLAHQQDGYLLVSYPLKGVKFSTKVSSEEEVVEVLPMILTYPDPAEKTPKP